jgi:hypothetical protein
MFLDLMQGWRRGAQQDVVLGQDNVVARRLHAGLADTAVRKSTWSAGVASSWSSTTPPQPPSSSMTGGRSSSGSTEQGCWMTAMNKQQQQQASSRIAAVPNLEISLGRQGWQHNLHDHQQQRSGESATAGKELTLLKCL